MESVTVTCSCMAKGVLMVALCGVPALGAMFAGGLPKFVREKFAEVAMPEADAITVYGPPAKLLAVKTGAIATPDVFVDAAFVPAANVPLGPLVGAENVTKTPLTGLPKESFIVTCS